MRAVYRHASVAVLASVLIAAFLLARADLHHTHQWNRAFADASLLLLAAALALGPLARAWPATKAALPWRRELGVWCFLLAAAHVGVYANDAFSWDMTRFVYGTGGPHQPATEWRRDAWAAANWVGFAALLYAIVPAVTSNDLSQRLLGGWWRRAQAQSMVFYALAMLHTFLFALVVYTQGSTIAWVLLVGVAAAVATVRAAAWARSRGAKA